MTIPVDGDVRIEYLPTIDTSTEKPLSPASLKSMIEATSNATGRSVLVTRYIKHSNEGTAQPTARILPDPRIQPGTGRGYWSDDAWAQRLIFEVGHMHLLFTAKEDGSLPNRHLGLCYGDAFILMLSDTKGSGEALAYRDLLPGGGSESKFIEMVMDFIPQFQHVLLKHIQGRIEASWR